MRSTPASRPTSDVPDFRRGASRGLAYVGVVLLTPFAINGIAQGWALLGGLALGIVVLLALNVLYMRHSGDETPLLARIVFAVLQITMLSLTTGQMGIAGLLWAFPTILSLYLYLPERIAWLANLTLLATVAPAAILQTDPVLGLRIAAAMAVVSVFSAILVNVIGRQQALLEERLVTDPLTGLRNRNALDPSLRIEILKQRFDGTPMALLVVDLDHFKRVNDTLGHAAGDEVLRALGRLLTRRSRVTDTAFRFGGEEFLVLLRDTKPRRARQIADGLCRAVATEPLLADERITASIGVACLTAEDDEKSWIRRADDALYRAKAGGRNRVEGPDTAGAIRAEVPTIGRAPVDVPAALQADLPAAGPAHEPADIPADRPGSRRAADDDEIPLAA